MKSYDTTQSLREPVRVYKTRNYHIIVQLHSNTDHMGDHVGSNYFLRFIVGYRGKYVDCEYSPVLHTEEVPHWHREDAHIIATKYLMPMYGRDTFHILARRVRQEVVHMVARALLNREVEYDEIQYG